LKASESTTQECSALVKVSTKHTQMQLASETKSVSSNCSPMQINYGGLYI